MPSTKKILFVEDDIDSWSDVMKTTLHKYDVEIVSAFETALEEIDTAIQLYDLCIINMNLMGAKNPNIQHDRMGADLLSHIRQKNASIPCILITGDMYDAPVDEWFKKYNVSGLFVKKNFSLSVLRHKIEEEVTRQDIGAYTDFDLVVSDDGEIEARSADQGEAYGKIALELPDAIKTTLRQIENDVHQEDLFKNFGKQLYRMIFPDSIHTHFEKTDIVAKGQRKNIRIRLNIKPAELSGIPWEFIYREEGGYFLSINPRTVLSRYLGLSLPPEYIRRREGPLHLLIIISQPEGRIDPDPAEWSRLLSDAVTKLEEKGLITTEIITLATRQNIKNALRDRKPDIVQFVGHGSYEEGKGILELVESDTGQGEYLDDEQFADIFSGYEEHLGLICLATCESAKSDESRKFSGIAAQLVRRGIPAVIAMNYDILVSTARIFFKEFYTSVAARRPVDWAVQEARKEVSLLPNGRSNREFATPVLFMRAKDGNIF